MQRSFGSTKIEARLRRDSALMRAHALIAGRASYSSCWTLQTRSQSGRRTRLHRFISHVQSSLLLGQWHNFPDPKLEEALRVRIDFMHFCGLGLSDDAPDETALCPWKKDLGICNLDVGLMETFTDGAVEHQECMARGGNLCRFKLKSNEDQPINQTL